jgi:hypothetical protein
LTTTIGFIIAGIALLVYGRKLFWLVVGASGFLVGVTVSTRLFHDQPESALIVIGLAVGALGAILAILVQKIAIGLAGFLVGGYGAYRLLEFLSLSSDSQMMLRLPLLVGGVLGLAIALFMFEWALVVLSSMMGSALIVYATQPEGQGASVVFIVLFILGLVIQSKLIARKRAEEE